MQNRTYIAFLSGVLGLALGLTVFAAGGGGGGGGSGTPPPTPCILDKWECGDWSECSIEGNQSRACTLVENCPVVEEPSPAETQSCTPACTQDIWECGDWGACSQAGQQTRTCSLVSDCDLIAAPMPIEAQTCQPACTQDIWECGEFGACGNGTQSRACSLTFDCPAASTPSPLQSQGCTVACISDTYSCTAWSQCQEDGRQARSCSLANDCAGVSTPAPEKSRICPGLRCGHLENLGDRISCRLGLSNDELAQEFNILYFPEYCKVEETVDEKRECIALYQSLGACWQLDPGPKRGECAKNIIGLLDLGAEKVACQEKSGEDRVSCVQTLKERVENLIIFHLYELEVQAETLLANGAVLEQAVLDLETFIETRKQEVETAESIKQWREIILEVRAQWKEFIKRVI